MAEGCVEEQGNGYMIFADWYLVLAIWYFGLGTWYIPQLARNTCLLIFWYFLLSIFHFHFFQVGAEYK